MDKYIPIAGYIVTLTLISTFVTVFVRLLSNLTMMPAVEKHFLDRLIKMFLLNQRDLETVPHIQTYHSRGLTFCVPFLTEYFKTLYSSLFGSSWNALRFYRVVLSYSIRLNAYEFHSVECAFCCLCTIV